MSKEPDGIFLKGSSGSQYESHLPPEGINVSSEHPLKEFSLLILGGLMIVVVIVASLSFFAGWLAPKIPFEYEQALADRFAEQFNLLKSEGVESFRDELSEKRQFYLDQLTEKYLRARPLPKGFRIKVHYVNDDLVNAFATIGGHVFIHGGLFDAMETENALAFVLGHEFGHVIDRHPIMSMGRGLVVVLGLGAMLGMSDSVLPDWMISNTSNVALRSFNRKQEAAADNIALEGVQALFGHTEGANEFFEYLLNKDRSELLALEVLQTHPLHDSRVKAIKKFAAVNTHSGQGLVFIPEDLKKPDPSSDH